MIRETIGNEAMSASNKVAVVGAGAMGAGIAQVAAMAGHEVLLYDGAAGAAELAVERIAKGLDRLIGREKITSGERDAIVRRLIPIGDIGSLEGAAIVIEAVIEDLTIKQTLFRALEGICADGTILATNTSSLSVAAIGAVLENPQNLVGLHFFNPAHIMKLVEVVQTPVTDPKVAAAAVQFATALGKSPILCKDSPGFVVNRCARPYYGEALCILEENQYSAAQIDMAMRDAGYRMGPFELIDLIGADINYAATVSVYEALGKHPRYFPFDCLKRQIETGNLGRKSGRGFIEPGSDEAALPDHTAAAIVERIEAALVNEAHFVVAEDIAGKGDVDTAMKLGLNFPRGPFEILALRGAASILSCLDSLRVQAPVSLRGRYKVSEFLVSAADG